MTARARWAEPERNRDHLASLTRFGRSRVLAPDGARARLGELDSIDRADHRRAIRVGIAATGALVLVLVTPVLARALGTSDLAHSIIARAVEHAVSRETDDRLTVGGVDQLDGEHLALHGVRLEDANGDVVFELDAVELDYDARSLLAGRLVAVGGRAKGGRVTLARAQPHDRDVGARTDLLRFDRLEAIHVAVRGGETGAADAPALMQLRVASDGAVVVDVARL